MRWDERSDGDGESVNDSEAPTASFQNNRMRSQALPKLRELKGVIEVVQRATTRAQLGDEHVIHTALDGLNPNIASMKEVTRTRARFNMLMQGKGVEAPDGGGEAGAEAQLGEWCCLQM